MLSRTVHFRPFTIIMFRVLETMACSFYMIKQLNSTNKQVVVAPYGGAAGGCPERFAFFYCLILIAFG